MADILNARLDHLALESSAPAEMAAFYAKVLQSRVEKVGGEWMVSREGRSVHSRMASPAECRMSDTPFTTGKISNA